MAVMADAHGEKSNMHALSLYIKANLIANLFVDMDQAKTILEKAIGCYKENDTAFPLLGRIHLTFADLIFRIQLKGFTELGSL